PLSSREGAQNVVRGHRQRLHLRYRRRSSEGLALYIYEDSIRTSSILKWDGRWYLFEKLQYFLRGASQTKLFTKKNDTIKTGLCTKFMVTVIIPGDPLRFAGQLEIAFPILHRNKVIETCKLKKEL